MLENVHGIFSICVHIFVREDFSWDFTRMYPAKKGCSGMKSAAYPLVMTKFTGSHGVRKVTNYQRVIHFESA